MWPLGFRGKLDILHLLSLFLYRRYLSLILILALVPHQSPSPRSQSSKVPHTNYRQHRQGYLLTIPNHILILSPNFKGRQTDRATRDA